MSRTIDHYERYNKLVKLITRLDASDYPAARLILHVMEQQQRDNKGLPFDGNHEFIETDGNNQYVNDVPECPKGKTKSPSWVQALNEFSNVPTTYGRGIDIKEVVQEFDSIVLDQKELAEKLFNWMYEVKDGSKTSSLMALVKDANIAATTAGRPSSKSTFTIIPRSADQVVRNIGLDKIYPWMTYTNCPGSSTTINGIAVGQVYAGTGVLLNFKPDKAILTLLLDRAYQQASVTPTGPTSTNFFSGSSSGTVPDDKDIIFYRKMGDSNALYRKENGVEIRVEKGSKEYMNLKDDGNCYTTGFTGSAGSVTCANLVKACLAGNDITKCKAYMTSNDWNDQLANEKINPDIAIDLLRKFGFGTKTVTVNEIGRNLQMIEDYDEWISNLTKNFTGAGKLDEKDVQSIASNAPLTGYLKKLISLINSNPGILNRDYVGKANLTQNPNAFASTQLGRFGLLPKQVVAASGVPTMSSVLALQNAVMSNRNQIGMSWGVMPQGVIFQMGGGMSSGIAEVLENAQNNSTFPLKLSKLMEESFKSFVTSLKSHGKDLDSGDKNHIHTLINELTDKEDKLFKAAIYTDKYVRLIGALGQTDSNKVVSIDHAKQFVDRRNSYFSKVGKKQDDLFSILKALAEAQQQETTVENKSVTDYPRF